MLVTLFENRALPEVCESRLQGLTFSSHVSLSANIKPLFIFTNLQFCFFLFLVLADCPHYLFLFPHHYFPCKFNCAFLNEHSMKKPTFLN